LADSADGLEVGGGVGGPGFAFFFDGAEGGGAFGEVFAEGVELVQFFGGYLVIFEDMIDEGEGFGEGPSASENAEVFQPVAYAVDFIFGDLAVGLDAVEDAVELAGGHVYEFVSRVGVQREVGAPFEEFGAFFFVDDRILEDGFDAGGDFVEGPVFAEGVVGFEPALEVCDFEVAEVVVAGDALEVAEEGFGASLKV
jgi:hypothetical protein